jgi:hypothetical protein
MGLFALGPGVRFWMCLGLIEINEACLLWDLVSDFGCLGLDGRAWPAPPRPGFKTNILNA